MKPIIVALDFSYASINAANFAADMALFLKADIVLLHVLEVPVLPYPIPRTEYVLGENKQAVEEGLSAIRKQVQLRTDHSIQVFSEIRYGALESELNRVCVEKSPFAVVMGIKKRNAVLHFLMGNTVLQAMRRQYFPILVVPEEVSYKGFKSIAIASDLQYTRENSSIFFIKEWLSKFHVSPQIIYINSGHSPEEDFASGLSFLQRSFEGFKPQFHFINKENIYNGIHDFAIEHKTDLIIVMPERHGVLQSLFHVSQSRQIALHSQIPVLSISVQDLVPGDEKGEEDRLLEASLHPGNGHGVGMLMEMGEK